MHPLWSLYLALRSAILFFVSLFDQTKPSQPVRVVPLNPILEFPATVLAQKIREGTFSSRQVVEAYIARINEVNGSLNAMVANRFAQALQEADLADAVVKAKKVDVNLVPFLGVPCTIKENFALCGMPNTSGLVARVKNGASKTDAAAVRRLKTAGFIPLGVTNTSELCLWFESKNQVYGRTNNPYDLRRMPGGSSGGEGALISAAGSVVGLGTDIGGSIRMPAFFNGIWGLKATGGVIPNDGQHPMAENEAAGYNCTGPLCRYAEDLWPMFKVLADPYFDSPKKSQAARVFKDPQSVKLSQIKFISLYGIDHPLVQPVSRDLRVAQEHVEQYLLAQGVHRKSLGKDQLKNIRNAPDIWSAMLATAASHSYKHHLGNEEREIRPLLELLKRLVGKSDHTTMSLLMAFTERIMITYQPARAAELCGQGKRLKEELADILGDDTIILFPSHACVAPFHHEAMFTPFNFSYDGLFNVLETPMVQCPLDLDGNGIPLGIQVGASHNNEHLAVAVALELARGFGGWVRPLV